PLVLMIRAASAEERERPPPSTSTPPPPPPPPPPPLTERATPSLVPLHPTHNSGRKNSPSSQRSKQNVSVTPVKSSPFHRPPHPTPLMTPPPLTVTREGRRSALSMGRLRSARPSPT